MRDAFLIFLLVLAGAILGGYGWFAIWLLRSVASEAPSDDDDEGAGCGLWAVLIGVGCVAIPLTAALISVVGHAVGVDMSQLTKDW